MQTPKHTKYLFASLLLFSTSLPATDINPALRNIRDYPDTPHFDNALNNIPEARTQSLTSHESIIVTHIKLRPGFSPDPTPFDPKSLKLNLDLPTFPQLNPAALNQQLFAPPTTSITPTTTPATTTKK